MMNQHCRTVTIPASLLLLWLIKQINEAMVEMD